MTWHETLSLQEKQVRGLGPDGEISTHSASSQGKWVPGYAQATRLKGNIPRARGHYIEAHKGQISRSVFVINSKSVSIADPKWQKELLANQ